MKTPGAAGHPRPPYRRRDIEEQQQSCTVKGNIHSSLLTSMLFMYMAKFCRLWRRCLVADGGWKLDRGS